MSTIYTWGEAPTVTALETSTADKVHFYDASAGVTKEAFLYDLVQMPKVISAVSSNGSSIGVGGVGGIATMGTSTAVVLAAPTRAGIELVITSGTSTVAYTITAASGSTFGTGTVWTQLGGGSVWFGSVSTVRWAIGPHVAHGSTLMA